jgi:hypothetical protein
MTFRHIRMYSDNQGETHFEELAPYQMHEYVPGCDFSDIFSCDGFFVEKFTADFTEDWHNPPDNSRFIQFFVEGQMCFEVSDGTKMTLGAGDALFFDDTTGKGHKTHGVTAGRAVLIKMPV